MLCEPFIHSDNILGNVPHDWNKAALCIAHIVLQCGSLEQVRERETTFNRATFQEAGI